MKPFSMIVAFDSCYGIGKKGGLPWHLPLDLKHFQEITCAVQNSAKQNAVIMGRKTWESLPDKFRPLPGRLNVVLTRDAQCQVPEGVLRYASLEEALTQLPSHIEDVFVIGGAQVFARAINHPLCHKLHVTHVRGDYGCDVFFPALSQQFFLISASEEFFQGGVTFQFCEYLRHH